MGQNYPTNYGQVDANGYPIDANASQPPSFMQAQPGQVRQNPDGSRSIAIDPRYFSTQQWEGKAPTVGVVTGGAGRSSTGASVIDNGNTVTPSAPVSRGQVRQNPDGSRSTAIDPGYYSTEQWEGKAPGVGIATYGARNPLQPAQSGMAALDGNQPFTPTRNR
jgi:hypothetical protein